MSEVTTLSPSREQLEAMSQAEAEKYVDSLSLEQLRDLMYDEEVKKAEARVDQLIKGIPVWVGVLTVRSGEFKKGHLTAEVFPKLRQAVLENILHIYEQRGRLPITKGQPIVLRLQVKPAFMVALWDKPEDVSGAMVAHGAYDGNSVATSLEAAFKQFDGWLEASEQTFEKDRAYKLIFDARWAWDEPAPIEGTLTDAIVN